RLRGAAVAGLGRELLSRLGGDRLDRVAPAEARVRLPVGHVRAETALLDGDRLATDRVVAELFERRRGGPAAAGLGRREQGEGVLEGGREELLLRLERARLGALLHIRPVAAVRGDHGLAVHLAERPRQ